MKFVAKLIAALILALTIIFPTRAAFAASPLITGMTISKGPTSGWSYVGIIGENLTKDTVVSFDGD